MMKKCNFFLKELIFSILVAVFSSFAFGQNWTLAAEKFSSSQKNVDPAVQAIGSVLPSLILEQIAENLVRMPRVQELLDQKLYDLRNEKLSLFLQLSKEIKTRDAIFLDGYSERKLKYKIRDQDKKIAEIQAKIDANLEKTRNVREEFSSLIAIEEDRFRRIEQGEVEKVKENQISGIKKFLFPLKDEFKRELKKVDFYKNDVTKLFEFNKKEYEKDYNSYAFEKACVDAKISGLLTGTITVYGSYISVSVNLYSFPGAKIIGSAVEVGERDDLKSLSIAIAGLLTPKIADSMPVELEFNIEPEDARKELVITVDDMVYRNLTGNLTVQSGVHRIMFSAPGYNEISTSYGFIGNRKFNVKAQMTKSDIGYVNLYFKKYDFGDVFARGQFAGKLDEQNMSARISIDGQNVLGHFIDMNGHGADFFIPSKFMKENADLALGMQPFDRSKYIEKRRKWMYTSYSALIVSLIPTFYVYGNSFAASKAHNLDYGVTRDDASKWQNASYITIGISGACGAWFLYELVRYLQSANTVLPARAKPVSQKGLTKIKTKNENRVNAKKTDDEKNKNQNENAVDSKKTEVMENQKMTENPEDQENFSESGVSEKSLKTTKSSESKK